MELTPGQRRALQYWGAIESATRERADTAGLWERIRAQAEALGYESPGVTARDISFLRSMAVEGRNAYEHLQSLGPDDYLGPEAIGTVPYARPLQERLAVNRFQVRFEHTIYENGELKTVWRSSMFTGEDIPRSRRELELRLNSDAANMAAEYGVGHGGVGTYTISEL